jgi:hypothetical protein
MERFDLDDQQALAYLARLSQNTNVKFRDIAAHLVKQSNELRHLQRPEQLSGTQPFPNCPQAPRRQRRTPAKRNAPARSTSATFITTAPSLSMRNTLSPLVSPAICPHVTIPRPVRWRLGGPSFRVVAPLWCEQLQNRPRSPPSRPDKR